MLLLKFTCENELFTLDAVNEGFERLNLQYMDENTPTSITLSCLEDGHMKQNGNNISFGFSDNLTHSFSDVDFWTIPTTCYLSLGTM